MFQHWNINVLGAVELPSTPPSVYIMYGIGIVLPSWNWRGQGWRGRQNSTYQNTSNSRGFPERYENIHNTSLDLLEECKSWIIKIWSLGKRHRFNWFFKEQKLLEYFSSPGKTSPNILLSHFNCRWLERSVIT